MRIVKFIGKETRTMKNRLSFLTVIALVFTLIISQLSFPTGASANSSQTDVKYGDYTVTAVTKVHDFDLAKYLSPYFVRPAKLYKENGQQYVEIIFTEKMYRANVLQAVTINGQKVDGIIVQDNKKKDMDRVYTVKFPVTTGNYLDIYVDAGKYGKHTLRITFTKFSAEMPISNKIAAGNIKVTNNYKKNDVIELKKLVKNATYRIYSDQNKKSLIKTIKASSTTAKFTTDKLNYKGGAIYVTVQELGKAESKVTKVSYKAEKLPKLAAKNVSVKNNIKNDKISFKGLSKGTTYTVYKDAKLTKKLFSFKATKTTYSKTIKQIGAKKGSIYVVASKSGYQKSAATKVNYKAEPTPKLASKNVKITNKKKGKDTVTLSGLQKGTTYVIYKDAKKKKKLATIKATKTKHSVKVNLSTKGGKVYITAKKPGLLTSGTTTVSYKKAK